MRICVIFNPAARGNKARHFRRQLNAIGSQCALKATTAPGDARRLAAEAVGEGFDLIVAAGGDGTVNEALRPRRRAGRLCARAAWRAAARHGECFCPRTQNSIAY